MARCPPIPFRARAFTGLEMAFSINLAEWAKKAEGKANLVVKSVIVDIARRVDEKSPVGKREIWAVNIDRAAKGLPPVPKDYKGGHFRANWQLGIDARPTEEIQGIDYAGSLSRNEGALPDMALGKTFYLTNNVPYAIALENGHSTQAPLGIVGITILEWQGVVRRNVRGTGLNP